MCRLIVVIAIAHKLLFKDLSDISDVLTHYKQFYLFA